MRQCAKRLSADIYFGSVEELERSNRERRRAQLVQYLGTKVPIAVSGNFRIGDIRHNYACMQRATRLLGFQPRFDFATGSRLFCDWVKKQGPVQSDYEGSIREMKQKGLLK